MRLRLCCTVIENQKAVVRPRLFRVPGYSGMGEAAGQELFLQINREKPGAQIHHLVACHAKLLETDTPWIVDIPFGSRQHAQMKQLFLQRR